jgi:type 1 fimbria pilin
MKKFFIAVMVLALALALASPTYAAEGKIKLSVGADVLIPTGDFSNGQSTGFGGSVRGQYDITPMFSAGLTVGYFTWSGKDYTVAGQNVSGASFKGLPVRVFGKYYFMPEGATRVYAIAELGLFFSSVDVPSQTVTIGGFTATSGGGSVSSSDFNYAPGVGVELPLGSGGKTMLDLSARYDGIARSGASAGSIGFRAGVIFGLGS